MQEYFSEHPSLRRLPEVYLAVALIVASLLCWITPPLYTPDETAHVGRALSLLQGHWLMHPSSQGTGDFVDIGVDQVGQLTAKTSFSVTSKYRKASDYPDGRYPLAVVQLQKSIGWQGSSVFEPFQNTAIYPPVLYLQQLPGWMLGQHLHWSVVSTLRLVRLINVLVAVLLGWIALRIARSYRPALFCLLLLPTVLSLNASCSQDALILPLAVLALAVLSRALEERRMQTASELLLTVLLLAVCTGARFPYIMLAPALWLPVMEAENKPRLWLWIRPAVVSLPFLLAILFWQHAVKPIGLYLGSPECDVAAQVAHLRAHPLTGFFWMLIATLKSAPGLALKGFGLLGMNDVFFPMPLYFVLIAGTLMMVFASSGVRLHNMWSRVVVIASAAMTIFGISLAVYLSSTPVGSRSLIGTQSRYYLPLIPLVLLLWSKPVQWGEGRPSLAIVRVLRIAFVLGVLLTPWLAAHRFYGTGLLAALR